MHGQPAFDAAARTGPPDIVDSNDPDQLLAATAAGDTAAFRHLYEVAAPRLLALAVHLLGDRALAEEALQEAFVDAWRGARTFRPERGRALGWLATVLRNRALRVQRREGASSESVTENMAVTQPEAMTQLENLATRSILRRCLRALRRSERRALLLAFYRGLPHGEVAAVLREPMGTIKSRIRRGLTKLKGCVDEAHG